MTEFNKNIQMTWDGNQAKVDFRKMLAVVETLTASYRLVFDPGWMNVCPLFLATGNWSVAEIREEGRADYGSDGDKFYLFKK